MAKISRRQFIGVVGATILTTSIPFRSRLSHAAEFTFKCANNLPLTHPMNIRAKEAIENIKKETHGRVDIQLFPNNQLGSDTDMLSQVRSGAIQFLFLPAGILSTLVPVSFISGVGFAFPDYNHVWTAMDGDLGAHVRSAISKIGLHPFEKEWDNGYRQITTSSKPIRNPADIKGLKIRVPVSPLWTSLFKSLGASPTSINFAELYSSLQTKTVEAQENPLAIIKVGRLYEVQKYCAISNHMWDGYWVLAHDRTFKKLPTDLQIIISRNFNAAGLKQRQDVKNLNDSLRSELQSKGMVFNTIDTEPFRATLRKAGFYTEWHKKFGPEAWSLLEKYTGRLA